MPAIMNANTTGISEINLLSGAYYIGRDASVVPTDPSLDAVYLSGSTNVTVDGTLAGFNAIYFTDGNVTTNLADFVHVRQTGLLVGMTYAGISFWDDGSQLVNAGQISGSLGVLFTTVTSASVTNSGVITGLENPLSAPLFSPIPFATGLGFVGSDGFTLMNTGRIEGVTALRILNSSGAVDNSGTILSTKQTGPAIIIDGSGAPGTVVTMTNSGTIQGAVTALYVTGATLDFTNTGLITGQVSLDSGHDRILGTNGTILGSINAGLGNDRILSGLGDDLVFGNGGNDTLNGGAGDDTLNGDSGLDRLNGGAGDDSLLGGAGNFADTLNGGAGDDTMTGGAGADLFLFARNQGDDRITDFTTGDLLGLQTLGFTSFAQLAALARDTAPGMLIDLRTFGGGTILLSGFLKAGFDATDVLL